MSEVTQPSDAAAGFDVPGIPDLVFVDVADPDLPPAERRPLLDQLAELHRAFFPDHAHVCDEWEAGFAEGWPDDEVVVHLWLALDAKRNPVGEVILHTNLRRATTLVHFVAMDADTRHDLPIHWVASLADAFVAAGEADAETAGIELRAVMGEIPPQHLHKWARGGFRPVHADYREPRYGMHWQQHGPPEFFPMLAIIRTIDADDAGADGPAVRSFLIDHYRLPADDPTVAAILADADATAAAPSPDQR